MVTETEAKRIGTTTVTGKLMSSGRVNPSEITYQEHEMADLRGRLSRLEGEVGNLTQQLGQIQGKMQVLHRYLSDRGLEVPDYTVITLKVQDHEPGLF